MATSPSKLSRAVTRRNNANSPNLSPASSAINQLQSKLSSGINSVLGLQKDKKQEATGLRDIPITKGGMSTKTMTDQELVQSVDLFHAIQMDRLDLLERYMNIKGDTVLFTRKYGSVGPTLIQWAYLYKKFEIGRYLLSFAPERALDIVNSPVFYGENILHMAIVHGQADEVKYLCQLKGSAGGPSLKGGDVVEFNDSTNGASASASALGKQMLAQAATGDFFKRGSSYYFGELPLFFAVATNQVNLISTILSTYDTTEEKVQALIQCNQFGDNLLHICVFKQLVECYMYIIHLVFDLTKVKVSNGNISVFNENIEYHLLFKTFAHRINMDGRSPLTLAAELGYSDMFDAIMSTWR